MPIIKSAKKRVRQSEARRQHNKAIKTFMKNLRKNTINVLSAEGTKKEDAVAALNTFKSRVDQAWSKSIFKRNKSSNMKSRMELLFKQKFGEVKN